MDEYIKVSDLLGKMENMDKYIKMSDLLDKLYPVDPENDGSDGGTVVYQNLRFTCDELERMLDEIPAWISRKNLTTELQREQILAIGAGFHAILNNKRLQGAIYVHDASGKHGGPYQLDFSRAAEILCAMFDAVEPGLRGI